MNSGFGTNLKFIDWIGRLFLCQNIPLLLSIIPIKRALIVYIIAFSVGRIFESKREFIDRYKQIRTEYKA